jgi:type I restriction enzyme S subunit
MNDWLRTTLGEMISYGNGKIQTGPFGSQLHASDYVEDGIPCIMPANMQNNRVNLNGIARITKKDANRLSKHIVKAGDIIYSRRGDVTQKALIREKEVGYFCGTGCLLIRPGDELDSEFLIYYLSTPISRSWIIKQAVGATMPNLNTAILTSVPLKIPRKAIQQKIAAIFSALDKKIEFNNRINAELEAMAKTLYDYWFVQFDFPDENGKPYKTSGGKMVYNATLKREIPKEWEVGQLGDYISFKRGISYTSADIQNDGVPFINLNSFTLSGEFKYEGIKYFTGKHKEESLLSPGNLVIAITDVTRNADIIGKSFVIPNIFNTKLLMSCDVASVSSNDLGKNYLEQLFNSSHYHDYIKYFASGTLVLHLDLNGVNWFKTVIPPSPLLMKYESTCDCLLKQRDIVIKENLVLEKLRDWLLPMLMNGQVTVQATNQSSPII